MDCGNAPGGRIGIGFYYLLVSSRYLLMQIYNICIALCLALIVIGDDDSAADKLNEYLPTCFIILPVPSLPCIVAKA